jgi:hypothetical protein
MTSGVRKNPETITCEQCGTTSTWKGGRRKRYCSPACSHRARNPRKHKAPKRASQKQLSDQLKIARGHCADCKLAITENSVVIIDWDHRDPTTKAFTIAYKMNRVSDEQLINEINKCDAVCANCHRYRTHHGKHHLNNRTQHEQPLRLF